jgi:hypothetical protein
MCLHEQVRATESSVAVELLTTKPPTEAASRRPDGDPDGGMSERGLSGMIRVLDRRCKLHPLIEGAGQREIASSSPPSVAIVAHPMGIGGRRSAGRAGGENAPHSR